MWLRPICAYPLLSEYYLPIYHYKRMHVHVLTGNVRLIAKCALQPELTVLCCRRHLQTRTGPVVRMSRSTWSSTEYNLMAIDIIHVHSGHGQWAWLWWPTIFVYKCYSKTNIFFLIKFYGISSRTSCSAKGFNIAYIDSDRYSGLSINGHSQ